MSRRGPLYFQRIINVADSFFMPPYILPDLLYPLTSTESLSSKQQFANVILSSPSTNSLPNHKTHLPIAMMDSWKVYAVVLGEIADEKTEEVFQESKLFYDIMMTNAGGLCGELLIAPGPG